MAYGSLFIVIQKKPQEDAGTLRLFFFISHEFVSTGVLHKNKTDTDLKS